MFRRYPGDGKWSWELRFSVRNKVLFQINHYSGIHTKWADVPKHTHIHIPWLLKKAASLPF